MLGMDKTSKHSISLFILCCSGEIAPIECPEIEVYSMGDPFIREFKFDAVVNLGAVQSCAAVNVLKHWDIAFPVVQTVNEEMVESKKAAIVEANPRLC